MTNLYLYNPTCDLAVENGTFSYMPPTLLAKFEHDISPLMAFLGDKDDDLICETKDSSLHTFWKQFGIELPTFISLSESLEKKYGRIIPWGWSPVVIQKFKNTKSIGGYTSDLLMEQRNFFSRLTSVSLVNELNKKNLPSFVTIPQLPKAIHSIDEIIESLRSQPAGIVVKTLWSSSGRGLLFIRNKQQLQQGYNWIQAQLKKHKSLVVEPIYNKVQDASLQFQITDRGQYIFHGINYFDADTQGHFSKEYFHIPEKLNNILPGDTLWLRQTENAIIESLKQLEIHKQYTGPIGIDSMFVNEHGKIKFYPLVEANLRCNMGLVNIHIKKHFVHDCRGTWQITSFKAGEAPEFMKRQMKEHPIFVRNGKISKGFFPLSYFKEDTRFAAWGIIN